MQVRPILFSATMVNALRAWTKTQTRRVCKPAEVAGLSRVIGPFQCSEMGNGWFGDEEGEVQFLCPYGKPGDLLYVKESFWGCDLPGYGDQPCVVYDDEWMGKEYRPAEDRPWARKFGRIPSIHMPRECSRLTLRITDVRVQRLRDLSEADAVAEGTPCYVCGQHMDGRSESDCHCFHQRATAHDYGLLWESINGPGSWEANPWVWCVSFEVLQMNVDQVLKATACA